MADPVMEPTKAKAHPKAAGEAPAVVATSAGEVEAAAIAANQYQLRKPRTGQPTVILPGGQRVDGTEFVRARYSQNAQATMLGSPELLLTDDFRREHPGWKYEWPIADSNETRAYIRNEKFVPVPPEAIRKDADFALVGETITSVGNCVSWMRHILVAVPPVVWKQRHEDPANYALGRTATGGDDAAAELDSQFGSKGYRAEVQAFKDQAQERI